jgi:transcription elongation factor GreA
MSKPLLTQDGLDKVQKEYELLIEQRKDALVHLVKARELGDLSENGYYKASRAKLSFIDNRMRQIRYLLKEAEIIKIVKSDKVTVGCTVTIKHEETERTYQIVGSTESNPEENKLSHISPIGKAILGKKVGNAVQITTPRGSVTYTIVKIH